MLKECLIWVIQEAVRQYYIDKCCEVLQTKKMFDSIQEPDIAQLQVMMNEQFLRVVNISHLFRLNFVDLHSKGIEFLFNLHQQLLKKTYEKPFRASRAYHYLNKNMRVLYRELSVDNEPLFTMNAKGVCRLNAAFFDLLDRQDEAKMQYHSEEIKLIQDYQNKFSEFINLNACAGKTVAEAATYIDERLQKIRANLTRFEDRVEIYYYPLDPRVNTTEQQYEEKEEKMTIIRVSPFDLPCSASPQAGRLPSFLSSRQLYDSQTPTSTPVLTPVSSTASTPTHTPLSTPTFTAMPSSASLIMISSVSTTLTSVAANISPESVSNSSAISAIGVQEGQVFSVKKKHNRYTCPRC